MKNADITPEMVRRLIIRAAQRGAMKGMQDVIRRDVEKRHG